MNIVELLKRQHEEVRGILERMIAEDDAKELRALLSEVSRSLRLHFLIEEKAVYPAAGRAFAGDEDDEETVLESYEEHGVARRCLEVLEATSPSDRRFVVRAKVLKDVLENHIEEEENDLLPELEAKLGRDGIERLGDMVERRMSQLSSEATVGASPRSRGQRSTARRGRADGSRTTRRVATAGGRTRVTKARGTTRKSQGRARATGAKSGGARSGRETNGNKPRRGESTSRS